MAPADPFDHKLIEAEHGGLVPEESLAKERSAAPVCQDPLQSIPAHAIHRQILFDYFGAEEIGNTLSRQQFDGPLAE